MARKKNVRLIWIVVAGAILGAVLGNAVGAYIHSDNLPFFDVLAAISGMVIGIMLSMWRSTQS